MSCASTRSTEPRHFLERFDAFGGDFPLAGPGVAVTRGRAGLHRGEAAHAAVLFVEFAADFHDLARRLGAAGEQAAADHRVGQRQRLDDVAGLGDAAVGEDASRPSSRAAREQT